MGGWVLIKMGGEVARVKHIGGKRVGREMTEIPLQKSKVTSVSEIWWAQLDGGTNGA